MDTSHDAEILRRWDAGEDGVAIAKAIGKGNSTVYRALRRLGVEPSKAKRRPKTDWRRKHTAEQEREIVRRYEEGEPAAGIARAFNCSQATVRKVVLRNGGQVRPVGGRRRPIPQEMAEEMVRRYQQGASQEDIARALGTSQSKVSDVLRNEGGLAVQMRRLKNGGRSITPHGYVRVLTRADDPLASMRDSGGYVMEHRLVMARSIGRPLSKNETVHHINGDRKDNRLENLQLRNGKHGKGMAARCACCGSRDIVFDELE